MNKDHIYKNPRTNLGEFQFNDEVSRVFDDMITRSVPGYQTTLGMIKVISEKYITSNSRVYDLGCSLGTASVIAAEARQDIDYQVIGIDSSESMIEECKKIRLPPGKEIEWILEDVRESYIHDASLALLNFTLQFVPKEDRLSLLRRIHGGLNTKGALILSEKVVHENPLIEDSLFKLHHGFKKLNGYSELEISQKRTALENVLIPETETTHLDRLKRAGFKEVFVWFQCFNFISILAVK